MRNAARLFSAVVLLLGCGSSSTTNPHDGGAGRAGGSVTRGGSGGSSGSSAGAGGGATAGSGGSGGATAGSGGSGGATAGSGGSGGATAGADGGGGAGAGGAGAGGGVDAGDAGSPGGADSGGNTAGAGGTDGGSSSTDADADAAGPTGTAYVYVSGGRTQVAIFALDLKTGTLTGKPSATAANSPVYMAFAPDKKHIYGIGSASASAFAINASDGSLSKAGNDAAVAAIHTVVHPSGRWLLTAAFGAHKVSVLPITTTGALGAVVDTRDTANEAHQVMIPPSGAFVFVPCRGGNAVMQYLINVDTGVLAPNDPVSIPAETAGAGPRHGAFHPSGSSAYVLNELNGTVTSYLFDKVKGTLSSGQVVSAVPEGVKEVASAHLEVHPTGRYVYVSNRTHNSIGIFSVNAETGRLTVVGHETGGGQISTPRDFTLDPTGSFVLVANQTTGTLLVFRINQADGKLTRVGDPAAGLGAPSWVGSIALP